MFTAWLSDEEVERMMVEKAAWFKTEAGHRWMLLMRLWVNFWSCLWWQKQVIVPLVSYGSWFSSLIPNSSDDLTNKSKVSVFDQFGMSLNNQQLFQARISSPKPNQTISRALSRHEISHFTERDIKLTCNISLVCRNIHCQHLILAIGILHMHMSWLHVRTGRDGATTSGSVKSLDIH